MTLPIKAKVPWQYTVDQISTLAALDFPEFKISGIEVFVNTVKAVFYLDKTSSLSNDNITVVACAAGGKWIRQPFTSLHWHGQTTWNINASTGNDENDGTSSGTAIKTIREFNRRVEGAIFNSNVTINILSNITDANEVFEGFSTIDGIVVRVIGTPSVVYNGTITSIAGGSGNDAWDVTDLSHSVSWDDSECISNLTNGGRMIRRVGTACRGWVLKDLGSKTARISWTANTAETVNTFASATASFVVTDTYEVVSLPSFPTVSAPANAEMEYRLLEFVNPVTLSSNAGACSIVLCSFKDNIVLNSKVLIINSCFLHDGTTTNVFAHDTIALACAFLGDGGDILTLPTSAVCNWITGFNTFQGVGIYVDGAKFRTGTLYFYDCDDTSLEIHNTSVGLDAIKGENNTALIIDIPESGAWALCPSGTIATNFTATTSAAKPTSLLGVTYNYAELPVIEHSKQSGITGTSL